MERRKSEGGEMEEVVGVKTRLAFVASSAPFHYPRLRPFLLWACRGFKCSSYILSLLTTLISMVSATLVDTLSDPSAELIRLYKKSHSEGTSADFPHVVSKHFSSMFPDDEALEQVGSSMLNTDTESYTASFSRYLLCV